MTGARLRAASQPGAVAIVTSGRGLDSTGARQAALSALRDHPLGVHELVDGPLALAWTPSPVISVYQSESAVCLFEGALYDAAGFGAGGEGESAAKTFASAHARGGDDGLARIRGDYWAILWDRRARSGLVATDHLAVRGPFWHRAGTDTVVASELFLLLAALPRRPRPDQVAMAHWLAISAPPDGRALYEDVRRVQAGHLVELRPGRAETRPYWRLRAQPLHRGSRQDVVDELHDVLSRSIRRRLAGSTRPCVLLSGGLDSSVVAALATIGRDDPLHAYSAVFPDHPRVDEAKLIATTTRELGLPSTRIVVRGGSALRGAIDYLEAWATPPTTPNMFFWTPLMERAGTDGTDVLLDGEGGDELFGFSPYALADSVRRGRLLAALGLAQRFPGSDRPRSPSRVWRLFRRYGIEAGRSPFLAGGMHRARGQFPSAPPWMLPDTASAWLDTQDVVRWDDFEGPRSWAYLVNVVVRGVGPALVYEQGRRRAAVAGAEARHPLVDPDVIELVLRVPPGLAFDPRLSRPLFRDTVAGLLPDQVRLRSAKSSFDAIFHAAMAGGDLPPVTELLGAGDPLVGDYVDVGMIRAELLGGPPEGRVPLMRWAIRLWRLTMAECWLRYREDSSTDALVGASVPLPTQEYEFADSGPFH